MIKISYSAIVLDELSHTKLVLLLENKFPEQSANWKVVAHHMTINMGELPVEKKKFIGRELNLTVIKIGGNDKVIAVMVKEEVPLTSNKIPHITLAVNPDGGKAVMSNYITEWLDCDAIYLKGIVNELE